MSYILDALRRSQAERERGQVPGLDARPAAVAAVPTGPPGQGWRRAAGWVVVLLVPALALLWWWRATSPTAPVDVAVRAPAPVPAPIPMPESRQEPAAAPAPAPAPSPMPTVVSAPPAPLSAPVAPSAVAVPAVRPAASVAQATTTPTPTPLAALTPAQRRELPPLAMGGSIWSDNALSRFVIVNGQVVREGEAAAPGVVVERIEPRVVLLRWREMRLEVPL